MNNKVSDRHARGARPHVELRERARGRVSGQRECLRRARLALDRTEPVSQHLAQECTQRAMAGLANLLDWWPSTSRAPSISRRHPTPANPSRLECL